MVFRKDLKVNSRNLDSCFVFERLYKKFRAFRSGQNLNFSKFHMAKLWFLAISHLQNRQSVQFSEVQGSKIWFLWIFVSSDLSKFLNWLSCWWFDHSRKQTIQRKRCYSFEKGQRRWSDIYQKSVLFVKTTCAKSFQVSFLHFVKFEPRIAGF